MKSLTRQLVRSVDRYAIDELKIPGVILMENAGRGVADAIESFCTATNGISDISVAVVAGAGNNGGDGYVIARHLANRGTKVTTFLISPAGKITGDAAVNLEIIRNLGYDIRETAKRGELAGLAEALRGYDLIVDAVGGTGIRGSLRGEVAAAVEQINAAANEKRPVVAVDIPTGLDCDSGEASGPVVVAAMTVTFVARKVGFENPASTFYTGEVRVADIGIDPQAILAKIEND